MDKNMLEIFIRRNYFSGIQKWNEKSIVHSIGFAKQGGKKGDNIRYFFNTLEQLSKNEIKMEKNLKES